MVSEANFTRLLAEWRGIAAPPRVDVGAWRRALEKMRDEENALREQGRWVHGREDVFGIIGIQRMEVLHSAIIAWLLDPCARHGLGTEFLSCVLDAAFPTAAFEQLSAARIACEVTRADCRADIVISMPDDTIIFENKVDAQESEGQCDILFEHFRVEPGARFVFLCPTSRRPVSATGEAKAAFVSLGYSDIRSALVAALAKTDADHARPGRLVAQNYLITLQKEFA